LAHVRAAGLVDELGDDRRGRDRWLPLGEQHRRRAGWIEREETFPPLPGPFLHQAQVEAVLAEHEANEARMRAEGMVKQRVHVTFLVCLRRLTKRSNLEKGTANYPWDRGAQAAFLHLAIAALWRISEKNAHFSAEN